MMMMSLVVLVLEGGKGKMLSYSVCKLPYFIPSTSTDDTSTFCVAGSTVIYNVNWLH